MGAAWSRANARQARHTTRTGAHTFTLHRNHLLPPVHMSPAGKIVQPTPGPFSTNRLLDYTALFYFFPPFSFFYFIPTPRWFSRDKTSRPKKKKKKKENRHSQSGASLANRLLSNPIRDQTEDVSINLSFPERDADAATSSRPFESATLARGNCIKRFPRDRRGGKRRSADPGGK